jgi:SPP1 gp7 family putative phage head morphogenesis protein
LIELLDLQASLKAFGEKAGIADPVPDDHPHQAVIQWLEQKTADNMARILSRLRRRLFDGVQRENVGEILKRVTSPDLNEELRQELYAALLPVVEAGVMAGREQLQEQLPRMKAAPPVDLSFDWTLINQQARRWLERYTFELTYANQYSLTAGMETRLKGIIDNFITSPDMSIPQLSREAEKLFDVVRGEMIAVTEVTRVFAGGNIAAWKETKLVEMVRWNTANDKLVCPLCGPLNGQVSPIGVPFAGWIDHPPAHPRCRCWVTPVVTLEDVI